jgi:hypothetical protein
VRDFGSVTDRLIKQVRHWDEPRWRGDQADRMHGLIQLLADLAADAEGRPRRPVPRERAVLLPEQLRVMADDLLAAEPPADVLTEAAEAVRAVRGGF